MGMSKRCRSPADAAHSDNEMPRTRARCESEQEENVLLKLPGQMDIRGFMKDAHSADAEAALSMGLYLGFDSEEESGDIDTAHRVDEIEMEMAFQSNYQVEMIEALVAVDPWVAATASYDAAEEAAVAMGLIGAMADDLEEFVQVPVEDVMWRKWKEMMENAAEYTRCYRSDEEAAEVMGLSLGLESQIDECMPARDESDEVEENWKPKRPRCYSMDEQAAREMGLSLCFDGEMAGDIPELEELARLSEESQLREVAQPCDALLHEADEQAALAMGNPLTIGDDELDFECPNVEDANLAVEAKFLEAVDLASFQAGEESAQAMGLSLLAHFDAKAGPQSKKARLDGPTVVTPATPPKRVLVAKNSDPKLPDMQDQKRRRLAEEPSKGLAADTVSNGKRPVLPLQPEVREVQIQ